MKEALLKFEDFYLLLSEGDGMNLLEEDIEEGFVDYIMADLYTEDDIDECLEIKDDAISFDGAQIMLEKMCDDMTMDEFIEHGLAFYDWENAEYELVSFTASEPRWWDDHGIL